MGLRIKSQWYNEDSERSIEEIAGALAFNSWKIAVDRAIRLHGEKFIYQSDRQRLAVIAEYTYYQVQLVDRMAHAIVDDELRRALVTAMVLRLADHIEENSNELIGADNHGSAFIERFNQRSSDYSELGFNDQGPSYPFMRHLGYEIQQLMGNSQENRWVIDQVMDIDGPEIYKQLKRVLRDLFM